MDNALSSNSNPERTTEPFTIVALVSTDLTAGEMVHLDVDSTGTITSPNFVFIATTPRVAKIAALGAVTSISVTAASQAESTAVPGVSPAAVLFIPEGSQINADIDGTMATNTKMKGQDRKRVSTQKHELIHTHGKCRRKPAPAAPRASVR